MQLAENALQQLLCSLYGQACAQAVIDQVAGGEPLVLKKDDGSSETFTEVPAVKAMLREKFAGLEALSK
jgi:hypothetical protein